MIEAFLYGAAYSAGFCFVVAVVILSAITAVTVLDKVMMRRRYRRVIREAMGGLDREDIAELLGDGDAGGDS